MTLIAFHKFLISTAIFFCLVFAIRQVSEFRATGNIWTLLATAVLGIAAVALGYYLRHLRDFLGISPEGTGPATSGNAVAHSGNGDSSRPTGAASRTQAEISPVKGNGHDPQAYEELRRRRKR